MEHVERIIKLETIRRSVEECSNIPVPVIKERLLAECGKWWGTARQTAQGYLKALEATEDIVIDGENVWSWERWQKILNAKEEDYLKMEDILHGAKNERLS